LSETKKTRLTGQEMNRDPNIDRYYRALPSALGAPSAHMNAEMSALHHAWSQITQQIEYGVIAQLQPIGEAITAPLRSGPIVIHRDLSATLPVVRGRILAVALGSMGGSKDDQ